MNRKLSVFSALSVGIVSLSLLTTATPAEASDPPSITSGSCYLENGGPGWDDVLCSVHWTGGDGSVTATFTGNQWVYETSGGYAESNQAGVHYYCQSGHAAVVVATVTDSVGASDSRTLRVACH